MARKVPMKKPVAPARAAKVTAKKTKPAAKVALKEVPEKKTTKPTVDKYDQPGAPWWKKFRPS